MNKQYAIMRKYTPPITAYVSVTKTDVLGDYNVTIWAEEDCVISTDDIAKALISLTTKANLSGII